MNIAELDPIEQEKADGLAAFFSGGIPDCVISDIGHDPEIAAYKQRVSDDFEAQMNALMAETDEAAPSVPNRPTAVKPLESLEDDPATCERIVHPPALTPYDKARMAVSEARAVIEEASPGSDEFHRGMADLAEAQVKCKTEISRSTDDVWRKRRAIDLHRAGEGRLEYNSNRRTREAPNARRTEMTADGLRQHDLDMNAKRVWVCKKRKLGWSEDKIETELKIWWAKRLAKRAGA